MHRTRSLLLVATALLLAATTATYYFQRKIQLARQPVLPERLPENVQAVQRDWVYFKGEGETPSVEIRARHMQRMEQEAAPRVQLEDVRMKLFHKEGRQYDLVTSEHAVFAENERVLFSDGAVEIILGIPSDQSFAHSRLLRIRTSGVRVEAETGMASTEREAQFEFSAGGGKARGAAYDPGARELKLMADVDLTWRGDPPGATAMRVKAGHLRYLEAESRVYLSPWSEFHRGNLTIEAGDATVTIEKDRIQHVIAQQARGTEQSGSRILRFAAAEMQLAFSEAGQTERIEGAGTASLAAVSASSETRVNSDRIILEFEPRLQDSILRTALASGHSTLESIPAAGKAAITRPHRVLRSEVIALRMRDNGEEVAQIETHSPGTLDLLPSTADQPRRRMSAERMWLYYGDGNRLRSFRAVNAATETFRQSPPKPQANGAAPPPVARTWSNDLNAEFEARSGELTRIEQWGDFRYEEADRRAKAGKAVLDSKTGMITLLESARTWDETGSVSADRIVLDQDGGDFTAEGDVSSSRLPDAKLASGGMIAGGEPLQARAHRMESRNHNAHIVYSGEALLWQKANRLQAEKVEIDRDTRQLRARSKVVSQLVEADAAKQGKQNVIVIQAEELDYSDAERMAHYRGNVRLLRQGLDVRSQELRAWLTAGTSERNPEAAQNNRLERAVAVGAVEIVQREPGRTRHATAELAEYHVAEERVVLSGGSPQLVDSQKGITRGRQLTWQIRDNSLEVRGMPDRPGLSRVRRK
jgi:lipopolysaccharide export system protein LptA